MSKSPPFELPVKKTVTHATEAGVKYQVQVVEGKRALAAFLTKEEADYIVQAINSHELHKKLVAMLNQYLTEEFWYGQPKLAIDTMCEAIKEAEKQ